MKRSSALKVKVKPGWDGIYCVSGVATAKTSFDRVASFVQKRVFIISLSSLFPARALRALGLLLADGAPTVGGGKTF